MSSPSMHIRKNISLILLSLLALPITTTVTLLHLLLTQLRPPTELLRRKNALSSPSFHPQTILITGVGMAKGLALARNLHSSGHKIIGADFISHGVAGSGSVSKSLHKFYPLQTPSHDDNTRTKSSPSQDPYVSSLLRIVRLENVSLWISCSGVASALEDGLAKEAIESLTACRAVQFSAATTQKFHEKGQFMRYLRDELPELPVPETQDVTSHAQALSALEKFQSESAPKNFILKPVGMDDANRGDLTLLPKSSPEETARHVEALEMSPAKPWILQRFVRGKEYCTHALVVRGEVEVFVACPSSELLMHYEALPEDGELWGKMLGFTRKVAEHEGKEFTGHLSFDFIVEEGGSVAYPIECNPRAHTAVVLFEKNEDLAEAYMGVLGEGVDEKGRGTCYVKPKESRRYYWVGHDIGELLGEVVEVLLGRASLGGLVSKVMGVGKHLLFWRDGTFAAWDPAPWWWLYQVYWPMQFFGSLKSGKKWSRINASTNKMFEC